MPKIGSGQITLADLTDQRPIRLDLTTSLQIIQAQTGTVYNPDYSEKRDTEGQIIQEGQIIIPSLFFGQEETNPTQYFNKIMYNCSDEGDAIDYSYEEGFDPSSNENSYVDNLGRFHLRRNLTKNITIEATINEIKDEETGIVYSSVSEKISLYQVNYESGYSNFILSEDGRYDFNEDNTSDIKLISKLYYGAELVPEEQVDKYEWFRSEDGTVPIQNENSASFIVQRSMVYGHETFICQITLKNGMIFREQIKIDDRTDSYYSIILAGGPTILTPLLNKVSLSCQIWQGNTEFSGTNVRYNWYYIIDKKIVDFSGDDFKEISIILDGNDTYEEGTDILTSIEIIEGEIIVHLPKASLTIYCQAVILEGDKIISKPVNFMPIQYAQTYTAILNPETIFIPANGDGSFRGVNFEKQIKFFLVDESGEPLKYLSDTSNLSLPTLSFNEGKNEEEQEKSIKFSFQEQPTGENANWTFTILMEIDINETFKEWDSIVGTIQYQYLGAWFSKSFDIIKNMQGIAGKTGYTIDLTNSFHKFAGEERYALLGQETNFGYIAKIADEDLTIESITVPTITSPLGEVIYDSDPAIGDGDGSYKEIVSGLFITYSQAEKLFYLKTADEGTINAHYLEIENGNFFIDFKVFHSSLGKPITFRKLFTYGYTKTGNSYSLFINPTALVYSPATSSYDSPSISLTAQYQYRGIGSQNVYAGGKFKYSTDGKNFKDLESMQGVANFSTSLLSRAEASVTFQLWSENGRIQYDEETIPIVVSLNGAAIGGENLLRWTKELPLEENKWKIDDGYVTKGTDDSFSTLKFLADSNVSAAGYSNAWAQSPKSEFSQDYLGKTFCLSFYVKIDSLVNFDGYFGAFFVLNSDYSKNTKERYGRIFTFDNTGASTDEGRFGERFVKDKWILAYGTFTLPDGDGEETIGSPFYLEDDPSLNSPISWQTCKYFSVYFELSKKGKIEIKKPKLERGNLPSDWSPNSYDISYEDISGTNLIEDAGLYLEFKKVKNQNSNYILIDNLKPETTYTFSYYKSSWVGSERYSSKFRLELFNENGSFGTYDLSSFIENVRIVQTFTTPGENSSLKIYPVICSSQEGGNGWAEEGILTLEKVKLEIGNSATSYFITDDYLNDLIKTLENESNNSVAVLNTENGKINVALSELQNTVQSIQGSSITEDEVQGIITAQTSQFVTKDSEDLTWLEQLKGKIEINSSDATEPFIEISTSSGASQLFSIKITDNKILFNEQGITVAQINDNYLEINKGIFNEDLKIGKLRVAITDTGVGFLWG